MAMPNTEYLFPFAFCNIVIDRWTCIYCNNLIMAGCICVYCPLCGKQRTEISNESTDIGEIITAEDGRRNVHQPQTSHAERIDHSHWKPTAKDADSTDKGKVDYS